MGINVELVKTSFAAVTPAGEELSELFYDHLFSDFPEVKPIFAREDMAGQRKKLLASLKVAVDNLRRPEVLVPALEGLGLGQGDPGMREEHYPAVGQTLLKCLAQIAGPGWTQELNDAWAEAYDEIVSLMLQRSRQSAA